MLIKEHYVEENLSFRLISKDDTLKVIKKQPSRKASIFKWHTSFYNKEFYKLLL